MRGKTGYHNSYDSGFEVANTESNLRGEGNKSRSEGKQKGNCKK